MDIEAKMKVKTQEELLKNSCNKIFNPDDKKL